MTAGIRDQVVIVTGASVGIGANYSRFLAAQGAKVVMADIDEAQMKAVAAEIGESGGKVFPTCVDVTSQEDIAFLLSGGSAFITGQAFNVDGGAIFH